MTEPRNFLDEVYRAHEPGEVSKIYDDWAESYDADIAANGYATPKRCAEALAAVAGPKVPVLDFGCGTGLSGVALMVAGFHIVDGCDLSPGMLDQARRRGIYRRLWRADEPLEGDRPAIVASGVVSTGAAPPAVLGDLAAAVAPGGWLVFSFNDHTLADAGYMAALEGLGTTMQQVSAEHGEHLPGIGVRSTVFTYRRT